MWAHFLNFIFPLIEHSMKLASRTKQGRAKLKKTHKAGSIIRLKSKLSGENVETAPERLPQFFEDSVLAKYLSLR